MEYDITPPATPDDDLVETSLEATHSSFQVSARPVIAMGASAETESVPLPRSYGTESLTLLARDPHTIFAFWDIDWNTAFRHLAPPERKVHLRLLDTKSNVASTL